MAVSLNDERVQNASPTKLRVIKTHLAARYVPYCENSRYLIVVRDPKEILVSSYHFTAGVAGPLMPKPDVWFALFLTRTFPLSFGSTWAEHTAGYWALRHRPNVLVLRFRTRSATCRRGAAGGRRAGCAVDERRDERGGRTSTFST
jgi:hypothetical protein